MIPSARLFTGESADLVVALPPGWEQASKKAHGNGELYPVSAERSDTRQIYVEATCNWSPGATCELPDPSSCSSLQDAKIPAEVHRARRLVSSVRLPRCDDFGALPQARDPWGLGLEGVLKELWIAACERCGAGCHKARPDLCLAQCSSKETAAGRCPCRMRKTRFTEPRISPGASLSLAGTSFRAPRMPKISSSILCPSTGLDQKGAKESGTWRFQRREARALLPGASPPSQRAFARA